MAGIIQGQGTLQTDSVYDISKIFQHVKCNDDAFIRVSDNKVIQKVQELEFAAIFEVGRLMNKCSVYA